MAKHYARRRGSTESNGCAYLLGIFLTASLGTWMLTLWDSGGSSYAPTTAPYVAPTFDYTPPPYTGAVTGCVDGWISHSTGGGTCSYHGGER